MRNDFDFGPAVQVEMSFKDFLALVAILFSRAKMFDIFGKGHYDEYSGATISSLGQQYIRRFHLKNFLILVLAAILFGGVEPIEGLYRNI